MTTQQGPRDRIDDHIDRWHEIWVAPEGRDALVEAAIVRMKSLIGISRQALVEILSEEPIGRDLFDTLHALVSNVNGTATPAELATRCEVTRAGMTSRIDRLEAEGLVTRTPDPKDRRSTLITPTTAGRVLWDRVVKEWGVREMEMFSSLDAAELTQMNDLMRRAMIANGEISRSVTSPAASAS